MAMAMEMEMLDGRKEQHHKVEHVKFLDCEKEPATGMCESFVSLVYKTARDSLLPHVHNICIHESHIFHENADSIHALPISSIKYQYQERNVDGEFQSEPRTISLVHTVGIFI